MPGGNHRAGNRNQKFQQKRRNNGNRQRKPNDTTKLPMQLTDQFGGKPNDDDDNDRFNFRFTKKLGNRKQLRKQKREAVKERRHQFFTQRKQLNQSERKDVKTKKEQQNNKPEKNSDITTKKNDASTTKKRGRSLSELEEQVRKKSRHNDSDSDYSDSEHMDENSQDEDEEEFITLPDPNDSSLTSSVAFEHDDREIARYMKLLGIKPSKGKSSKDLIINEAMRKEGLASVLEGFSDEDDDMSEGEEVIDDGEDEIILGGIKPKTQPTKSSQASEVSENDDEEYETEDEEELVDMKDDEESDENEDLDMDMDMDMEKYGDLNSALDYLEGFMTGAGSDDDDQEDELEVDGDDAEPDSDGSEEYEDAQEYASEESEENNELDGAADDNENEEIEHMNAEETESDSENQDTTGKDSQASQPAPTTKYIPPALRRAAAPSDIDPMLLKQLTSSLNKLSSTNIASIITAISAVYSNYPRGIVTTQLTNLLLQRISGDIIVEEMITTFSLLVAGLNNTIDNSVGGNVIQHLIEKYDSLSKQLTDTESPDGKTCLNIAWMMSIFYNIDLISESLIINILDECVDRCSEFDLDILLKIIRTCGSKLRSDAPGSIKLIIQKIISLDTKNMSSRGKFLIECVVDLKNNRAKLIKNYKETLEFRLKKDMKLKVEPLRVTLNDIRNADTRGKWWVVGAAWVGHNESTKNLQASTTSSSSESMELLALAMKHGMNTTVRQSVFCVLMSSEDYLDAVEKISKLRLTDKQEREVIKVALYCAGVEKTPNQFYTHLLSHFCAQSHSNVITLQYALWDYVKDLEDVTSPSKKDIRKLKNLSTLYGDLMILKTGVTIMKAFNFTTLSPLQVQFTRLLLLRVLTHSLPKIQKAFKTITPQLKDGILFFSFQWIAGEDTEFWKEKEGKEWCKEHKTDRKGIEEKLKGLRKFLEQP